ncbi:hypothetical protein F2P45_12630 [Massilia sp. CCM 8733]|uniref:Transmembrane protein n=1 Tax=Massilia mucilaginosa TaxID=2609282 RepID=A0ABX0NSS3_9BURK|nr:hypothetical protein [Massilia mucilaginosa]NHZ89851.1 hypothetical protein [Massilia mucilaginosa]
MLIHASRLALIGIAIALLTFLAFMLIGSDTLGLRCGTFGLDCLGYAATTLVIGCGIGMYFAMASFDEPDTQPGLKWVSLALNGVPMLLGAAFWVMILG